MILEYKIDFRAKSQIYEKIFVRLLKKYSLDGKILRDGFVSKFYIKIENTNLFEDFLTEFSQKLPNSIFLYSSEVRVIDKMPDGELILDEVKTPMPFCLECFKKATDKTSSDYYNIFTQCDICGYDIYDENKNYEDDFKQIAKLIKNGENIKIDTFRGTFTVGKLTNNLDDFAYDIIAYDYTTISTYTSAKDYELKALASIEKPFVKLKINLKFKTDVAELKNELVRFKLPDDFVLYFLMYELRSYGIDMIFITKDDIPYKEHIKFVKPQPQESIEVVVSPTHIALVDSHKKITNDTFFNSTDILPAIDIFYSIIKQYRLENMYKNIAGVYLDKQEQSMILIHSEKFGAVKYLLFEFEVKSMQDLFDSIASIDESGKKLAQNYKNKFAELYSRIVDIKFEKDRFNIYELWGILSIVLDFTSDTSVEKASKVLEENVMLFLGERGPRIDYKLIKGNNITKIDPFKLFRSAMSFKIAGVDNSTLSYGIVESFIEFISAQLDETKENMGIEAVTFSGSILQNNVVFDKLSKETSTNHNIYFSTSL